MIITNQINGAIDPATIYGITNITKNLSNMGSSSNILWRIEDPLQIIVGFIFITGFISLVVTAIQELRKK